MLVYLHISYTSYQHAPSYIQLYVLCIAQSIQVTVSPNSWQLAKKVIFSPTAGCRLLKSIAKTFLYCSTIILLCASRHFNDTLSQDSWIRGTRRSKHIFFWKEHSATWNLLNWSLVIVVFSVHGRLQLTFHLDLLELASLESLQDFYTEWLKQHKWAIQLSTSRKRRSDQGSNDFHYQRGKMSS